MHSPLVFHPRNQPLSLTCYHSSPWHHHNYCINYAYINSSSEFPISFQCGSMIYCYSSIPLSVEQLHLHFP